MENKKITILARMKAKQGMEEEVKQELLSLVGPTRAEAGCINYDLHQSTENRCLFMLYENWVSKRALEEHIGMPYLKAFMKKTKEVLAEPADITLWEGIS